MISHPSQGPETGARQKRAQTFVTNVGALGILQILNKLQGLALLAIISNGFGPAVYGVWTQFFVASDLVGRIANVSLDDALIRFVAGAKNREERQDYYYSILVIVVSVHALVAALLALGTKPLSVLLFGSAEYAWLVILLGPYVVLEAVDGLALHMFQARLQIRLLAFLEASQTLVRLAAVATTIYVTHSWIAGLFAYLSVQLLWLLIELGLMVIIVGVRWPTFRHLRACLAFSLPLVPTRCAAVILAYSDRFVIAQVLGLSAVGVYAAAYDVAGVMWQIFAPLRQVLFPTVSQLWDQGKKHEAGVYIGRSMKIFLGIAFPGLIGVSALAPQVFKLISTAEFVQASYLIVPIVAGGIFLNTLGVFFAILLRLHKNTWAIAAGITLSAITHFGLNLVLIPSLGIVGGAVATLIGYGLELVLVGSLAWRHSRFPIPFRSAAIFLVCALPIYPLVIWWSGSGHWFAILGSVFLGAVTYLIIVIILNGISRQALRFVARQD